MVPRGAPEPSSPLTVTLAKAGVRATELHAIAATFLSAVAKDPSVAATAYAKARTDHDALVPSASDFANSLDAASDGRHDTSRVQEVLDELRLAERPWHPSQTPDAGTLVANGPEIIASLEKAAVLIQMLTIAGPLSAELTVRFKPGQALSMSEFLEGRVPASAQPQVVDFLAKGNNLLRGGVVDKKSGCVYRLPVSFLGRLWRYPLAPIACLAASAGLLVAAAWLGHQAGDHSLSRVGPWIVAWLAVCVGCRFRSGCS